MTRSIGGLLAGTALLAAAATCGAQPVPAPIKPMTVAYASRSDAVPFELFRGSRMFMTGTINGTPTAMLLDSGASITVIDSAFAEKLGLKGGETTSIRGAGGSVPGRVVGGVTLSIGALRLTDLSVIVIDMSPIARSIGRDIPVVLGRDAFKAGLVTIDFPRRAISFSDRASFTPPAKATRLNLGNEGEFLMVKLSVGDLPPVDAILDLGNGGTLLLAKSYWSAQPALAGLRYAQTQTGGVGGRKNARKVTIPAVTFGGTRLEAVPAILHEDAQALPTKGGNIGIEMLKPFVVTIDDKGSAMYIEATGNTHAFQRERAGIRTELAGDRLKVVYVSPDGPGAAAGLKVGDMIVAVDGQAVGPDFYASPEWIYAPAGKQVALTRADGSTVKLTLADYY